MSNTDLKNHWERIYTEKGPQDVSWTQEVPAASLRFIEELQLPADSRIIDVGGGDSNLVDFLLKKGYQNLSVLDLSAKALEKARERIGEQAGKVNWIASDVLDFQPEGSYDLWHDRATFHFLTERAQVDQYLELVRKGAQEYLLIGTFSDEGPEKCSGLTVERYDGTRIERLFQEDFELLKTWREDHITPGGKAQNFLFCGVSKEVVGDLSRGRSFGVEQLQFMISPFSQN